MEVHPARHLDRAAKGDFTVPLGEVIVAHGELGAGDVDREVDPRAPRDVLDVAVAPVLARRDRARRLLCRLRQFRAGHVSENDARLQRRQRERRYAIGVRRDKLGLAAVPLRKQAVGRRASDQPGMGDAREADTGDMPRRRIDAVEIPDRLSRLGIDVGQEAAAVLGREDARIAPLVASVGADVENVNDQDIARLGTLNLDRPEQMVARGQVTVANVVRAVVVLDLPARPNPWSSTRNSSPGLTLATTGISGCQRLCGSGS